MNVFNPITFSVLGKSFERHWHRVCFIGVSGFPQRNHIHCFIGHHGTWVTGTSSITFRLKRGIMVDRIGEPRDIEDGSILCKGEELDTPDILDVTNQQRISVDASAYASLLKECVRMKAPAIGKWVHSHMIKTGFQAGVSLRNHLVNMYAKCGSLRDARQVFDKMTGRNVVSWSAMIAGYAQQGFAEEALKLFCQMRQVGTLPNQFTFGSVLKACGSLASIEQGQQLHAHIIKSGLDLDAFVGSAIVDMYVKCKSLENASQMFYKMPERSVVSWTALIAGYIQNGEGQALELFFQMPKRDLVSWTTVISGYAQHGRCEEALDFFCLMQQAGVKPNQFTLASVLKACASLAALEQGKQLHADMIKSGFELDVFAGTAMVDVYSKCCSMEDARKMFDKMPERSVVLWSGIISGYAQRGNVEDALKFFCQMQEESIEPNQFTISSVLSACANLAVLEQGKQVHTRVTKSGLDSDVFVGSTLVDMYAKCGGIGDARRVFDKLLERNVVSWNAIIVGYAQHGDSEEVLKLFEQMQLTGLKPDQVTFLGLLSACAHAGLVDKGRHYLDSMSRDYGMAPRMDHFTCMVDLLGRAGHLDEAEELIDKMPFEPDSVVWRALLAACTIHGNMELGKRVAEFVLELEPQDDASYVLLSNINAAAGRWEDVAKARKRMKDSGVRKEAGCSWIEVKNRVHTFMVGDRSHPQTEEIYAKLDGLMAQMKEVGYIPDTGFVLHDV